MVSLASTHTIDDHITFREKETMVAGGGKHQLEQEVGVLGFRQVFESECTIAYEAVPTTKGVAA